MKKASFAEMKRSGYLINLSEGNRKLKPNKKVKFLIFNLPSIKTCPFATDNCKSLCYARKAEKAYPNCIKARERNFEATKKDDFVDRMIFTILAYLGKPSYQKSETVVVRIHESGDFYNKEYTNKWVQIAEFFADYPKVIFMAYTKSIRFFDGVTIPNNMVVRFSLWDDTKEEEKALAEKMGLPIYSAVDRFANESNRNRCFCLDCGTCGKCWQKSIDLLLCEIH